MRPVVKAIPVFFRVCGLFFSLFAAVCSVIQPKRVCAVVVAVRSVSAQCLIAAVNDANLAGCAHLCPAELVESIAGVCCPVHAKVLCLYANARGVAKACCLFYFRTGYLQVVIGNYPVSVWCVKQQAVRHVLKSYLACDCNPFKVCAVAAFAP